jgi:hypothetical protein
MRSFDLEPRETICQNAQEHMQMKDRNEYIRKANHLADVIQSRLGQFLSSHCPSDLEGLYSQLCGLKAVLNIHALTDIASARPPKENCLIPVSPVKEDRELDAYIRKIAEVKGTTQGMAERLAVLFPPPKGRPFVLTKARKGLLED